MRGAQLATLALVAFALESRSCNMTIETPKYALVNRYADFETRQYPALRVAETDVEGSQTEVGNEAFSRLAGYIFGKNQGARKVAMTAPVVQAPQPGTSIAMTAPVSQQRKGAATWRVQFIMPSEYVLASLPKPNDPRVHLREIPAKKVAVVRYSGAWSMRNYNEHLAILENGLRREGLHALGEPSWARYDPPYKPWFLRTNEISIEIA